MLETKRLKVLCKEVEREAGCLDTGVYELDPLHDRRWPELVERHPRSSAFHGTKWLSALKHTYGFDPVVVTTSAPGAALTNGLVFCRIMSWLTGSKLISLPFSDHCEPLVSNAEELDDLLRHMCTDVKENRRRYLEIRPVFWAQEKGTSFSNSVTYCFHRLALDRSREELFRKFHKDCVQRKIRRAEKEKVQYEEGTSEHLLRTFYRLLLMTRRRQSLPPQPIRWFRSLIAAFEADLKIRVASKDGVPVAAILTLAHKQTMVYKYGCSDAALSRFGGTALLFWRAIQEAHERGCQEFDMGRSDMDNPGLIAFKEHWGATPSTLTYWTYPAKPSLRKSDWKKKLAGRIFSSAPDFALKMAGTCLYRHMA